MKYILCTLLVVFVCFGSAVERKVPTAVPPEWTHSEFHKRDDFRDHEIKITVALSQRNIRQLESEFWNVSDPTHSEYGKYRTFQEIVDWIAPTQASIDLVTGYFQEKGIQSSKIALHPSRDFLTFYLSVAQAESIFQATYKPYVHSKTGDIAVIMENNYNLDEKINRHIDFVSTTGKIGRVGQLEQKSRFLTSAASSIDRYEQVNNAPFLHNPWADYQGVYLQIILLCPDGSAANVSGWIFISTIVLHCRGVNITSLDINIVSQITNNSLFSASLNITEQKIFACTQWSVNDTCQPIAKENNLPANAPFFSVYLDASTIHPPLPVYIPYVVHAFVTYSDNTTSATGVSSEVAGSAIAFPDVVFSMYSVPNGTIVHSENNSQSVVQYLGQSFNVDDLRLFFSTNNLSDYSNLVKVVHPENNDPSHPGSEATLDIQTIMGIAKNCTTVFWANNATAEDLDWIIDVLNQPTSPLVFSISYGSSESDGYTQDYFDRLNVEFMKAGVRGITIIYASGDDGPFVNGGAGGPVFDPVFPATSPYITSVGATQFFPSTDPSCFKGDNYTCKPDEVVCSIATGAGITGGGGFSNTFARPSYQNVSLSSYIPYAQSLSANGVNTSGRGYPDVTMIGHNAPVYLNGEFSMADGTSASAPFLAGLVTLLNDIRLTSGNAPLGFLNPFIYSLDQSAFNDIVRGSNNCTRLNCYPVGFSATPGWDAATGRGTPIFVKWAEAVTNLPPSSTTSTTSSTSSSPSSSTTSTTSSSTSSTSTTSSTSPTSPTSSTSGTSDVWYVFGTLFGPLMVSLVAVLAI